MTFWYLWAVKCNGKEPSSVPGKANDLTAWLPISLHREIYSCKFCLHPVLCGIANCHVSYNSCNSEFMKYNSSSSSVPPPPPFFSLIRHQQNRHDWICFLALPLLIYVRLLWGYRRWWDMWERFCTSLFQDSTSINGTDIAKYLPTGTN